MQRVFAAAQVSVHPESFVGASCQGDIRQKYTIVNELKCMKLPLRYSECGSFPLFLNLISVVSIPADMR